MASLGLFFVYTRKKLSPWKFIPVAIIVGYVTMVGGGFLASLAMASMIGASSTSRVTLIIATTSVLQFGFPLLSYYVFV